MSKRFYRSIEQPIRKGLSWNERWAASDNGLIYCWERGREMRLEHPELALQACNGELVPLDWKGGVEKKLKDKNVKEGTFYYLATWHGLRGEDLDIPLYGECVITCSRTGQSVKFSDKLPADEGDEI